MVARSSIAVCFTWLSGVSTGYVFEVKHERVE